MKNKTSKIRAKASKRCSYECPYLVPTRFCKLCDRILIYNNEYHRCNECQEEKESKLC